MASQLIARERGVGLYGYGEAERAWVGVFARDRQHQVLLQRLKELLQVAEVLFSPFDEIRELCNLREAERGLHIGRLEVITNVRVGVLVVVAAGKGAELPVEAF